MRNRSGARRLAAHWPRPLTMADFRFLPFPPAVFSFHFSALPSTTTATKLQSVSMSDVQAAVESAIASNLVVVYSKSYCPYSKRAKSLLASIPRKREEPKVFELDEMGEEGVETQMYLLERTGQRTVPNVTCIRTRSRKATVADDWPTLTTGLYRTETHWRIVRPRRPSRSRQPRALDHPVRPVLPSPISFL